MVPAEAGPGAAKTAIAARLRQAVRQSGGNKAVAERAGVPLGTLNNYLRGRNAMKAEALRAIADACHASLDWILKGTQPPADGAADPPQSWHLGESPQAPAPLPGGMLDIPTLAKAIELVRAATDQTALDQEATALARRIANIYAALTRPPSAAR